MNRFRKPARQYVGEDEETIVLSGVLSLSVLEAMADQHTAWPLPGAAALALRGLGNVDTLDLSRLRGNRNAR
ncbi:phage tail protein [Burkholderia multivorans]|uniref:phage tail protein n=1 Tax=Burkholderia multivorans TaxID=87883 RepID=UPI002019748F|nr:phage tail protein [Burkholderia multivorans]MCO1372481.1 phage tail protein [Burkholderia multivorans]MCO1383554.1 phage tail protein [Burkholderia multivorans]MCO1403958.1 phage tail protein [Burkholderia multivorans]MCO1456271.1 phage tail protein [Burkholderia multivorans]MCO1465256.1 phage tail protein [Burkholderia multivorans]